LPLITLLVTGHAVRLSASGVGAMADDDKCLDIYAQGYLLVPWTVTLTLKLNLHPIPKLETNLTLTLTLILTLNPKLTLRPTYS